MWIGTARSGADRAVRTSSSLPSRSTVSAAVSPACLAETRNENVMRSLARKNTVPSHAMGVPSNESRTSPLRSTAAAGLVGSTRRTRTPFWEGGMASARRSGGDSSFCQSTPSDMNPAKRPLRSTSWQK
jgi:hypothetical protein